MIDPADTPARYARLSIAAALATMSLKFGAWWLTGSVGLLSDAMESIVNLSAATMALWLLKVAARPADAGHAYGHGKAEYFAGAFEGMMIAVAALSILWAAWPRLFDPQPIDQTGIGLAICAIAARIMRASRRHRSLALEADARHLMTDVWTSGGVILGVALISVSGWLILDPLLGIAVALNILWTSLKLLQESTAGLMDAAWPDEELGKLNAILDEFRGHGIDFHAVRTRRSGAVHFVSFHVLVPGGWSVQRGHDLVEVIESRISQALAPVSVLTHLEPIEDPVSQDDTELLTRPAESDNHVPPVA